MRLLALTLLLSPLATSAQSSVSVPSWAAPSSAPAAAALAPPPGPPGGGTPPAPVPLDGGLSLLAAAGAGLAARRLRARRAVPD